MSRQNNAKGAGLTLLTAAAAAVTAGLCCVGPLLYLLFDDAVIGIITACFLATLFFQTVVVFWLANPETSARSLLVCAGVDFAGVILPNAGCLVL